MKKDWRVGNQFNLKHGHRRKNFTSPTYMSWKSMRARCNNPNKDSYFLYGGRGIKICKRWNKFENFLEDMGIRPEGMTLDRIRTNGNYEKSNCKWSTPTEQNNNKRNYFCLTLT